MSIIPRNTLVIVELIKRPAQKSASLTFPSNNDFYAEAIVVGVGPGNVSATGGRSETHDLQPGQRVLVKNQEARSIGSSSVKQTAGLEYLDGGRTLLIVEQTYVIAIFGTPRDQGSTAFTSE